MKNSFFQFLSRNGVVPLQLPREKGTSETAEEKEMARHLAEYEIARALTLFGELLRAEIARPGSSSTAQSAAMALFVVFLTSYFGRGRIVIPSPTSPRWITLEPALVKKSMDAHSISHLLSPSLSLSLMLLIGDFPCATKFCLTVKQKSLALGLLALSQQMKLSYNTAQHKSLQSTHGNEHQTLYKCLTQVAQERVEQYFTQGIIETNKKGLPDRYDFKV